MKGGYAIAVGLLAMVVMVFAEDHPIRPIPTECPKQDSKNYTVHIAHPTDCTKFYSCFRGNPIEMTCPFRNQKGDRLHFNPLLQVCDWPENAGCQNPVEGSTAKPGEWNTTWNCGNVPSGTMLPHETRCHLFYVCNSGNKKLENCAEGLHFDPYAQGCVPVSQSRCPVEGPCRDHKSSIGAFYPDYDSCKYVYYCVEAVTYHYPCPQDDLWSVDVSKCLSSSQAVCARRRYDY